MAAEAVFLVASTVMLMLTNLHPETSLLSTKTGKRVQRAIQAQFDMFDQAQRAVRSGGRYGWTGSGTGSCPVATLPVIPILPENGACVLHWSWLEVCQKGTMCKRNVNERFFM